MQNLNDSVGSPRWQLDTTDLKKIAKGLGIAILGSALSYAVAHLVSLDTSHYAWLVPVASAGINAIIKWLKDNS